MILTGADAAVLLADPLAVLHAACVPPADAWDRAAMAALLAMPGCFAVIAGAVTSGIESETNGAGGLALGRVAADEAELLTIGVLPPMRRRGIARLLLRELTGEAAARGARSLFLEVSVANGPALALYRGVGFAEVGRRRRYYPDGSDAMVLARSCLPDPAPAPVPAAASAA